MPSSTVLDASALLALLQQETGAVRVAQAITVGAAISTVSVSEVVAKLSEAGVPDDVIRAALEQLGLETVPFDAELAYAAGLLRRETRQAGLSLGDRACLALARRLSLPALTADHLWASLDIGIAVAVIR